MYDALKKADEQRRAVAKASDDLRGVMDENLCRRLIETCETLCHDPHTLDGAFHKWKGRMLRSAWAERPVHADVQDRINAKTPSHEIMADHHASHKLKHELHRPNPSFRDDLAPLPDLQRSRSKRPRTAPVGLRRQTRPSSARGLRPYAYEASSSSPNEAYRQTRRAPVHLPSLRGRCMHKLGSDVPDGHKIVVGSHGVGRPTSSGRGALSNIGAARRPRTAPSRPVLY